MVLFFINELKIVVAYGIGIFLNFCQVIIITIAKVSLFSLFEYSIWQVSLL